MMYVVTYSTESGDNGFVGVFKERPTEGHLTAITQRDFPDEIVVEDDGELISYLSYEVEEVADFSELPDPVDPIPTL